MSFPLLDNSNTLRSKRNALDGIAATPTAQPVTDETQYRNVIDAIDVGFCIIEMIFDGQGRAYDYRFLQYNPAFERHTGLTDALGKTILEMVPGHDAIWFEMYGNVARTGEPVRFESHAEALNRTFDVHAQRIGNPDQHHVAVFFTDISSRKQLEREKERLLAREHNIAVRLQDALQPVSPPGLPGLTLKGYYRPALAEAGVGGDFYDVFSLNDDCSVLAVGDLSGKGLSAASEVATVRNMVRYALYSASNLASAITELHRILSEHELLSGFATLFVGSYDTRSNTLRYTNCGQEPALIWRAATGMVETLPPTGPVLGGFAFTETFNQIDVQLMPGDVIAVFTDGMTDVGVSRKYHLELSGVIELFRGCCASSAERATDAQAVLDYLVAGVEDYGKGALKDDIALLVGVVKSAKS